MAKAKVQQRKDNKGRVLLKGESQRKTDGMYIYTYVSMTGGRRYVYSKDLLALREKKTRLLKDQLDGLDVYAAGKATVDMAFDRYMSTKYHLRESTRSNYNYMYDQYIRGGFGNSKASEVRYSDVLSFYYYLINERNLQVNTVDSVHCVLHPTFGMLVRDDVIRKNPTDGVMAEILHNTEKNKGVRHALTAEQQQAFITAIESSPEYFHWLPLFTFLLGTGCRIGEAVGIRWCDIDFKKRCININHSASYYPRKDRKSYFEISLPKTEAGVRDIPMFDTVYEVLKMEYERQKEEGFCTFELDRMTGFVFSNKLGRLHNPHCVNLAIQRISEGYNAKEIIQAKKQRREPVLIPHFSCHHLRHTFCSRLCENDVNVKVIQEVMGHANIETTLDIYAEVNYNKKKDSFEELSRKVDVFRKESLA